MHFACCLTKESTVTNWSHLLFMLSIYTWTNSPRHVDMDTDGRGQHECKCKMSLRVSLTIELIAERKRERKSLLRREKSNYKSIVNNALALLNYISLKCILLHSKVQIGWWWWECRRKTTGTDIGWKTATSDISFHKKLWRCVTLSLSLSLFSVVSKFACKWSSFARVRAPAATCYHTKWTHRISSDLVKSN